jgi:indolepyruvate ferredoxin oxidoreductase, beta subunit
MKYDILIAGVGGQGTILASRLLAASAMDCGFFTRTAETIGMSQRGGSVVSHVRIESEQASPVIPLSGADLLIGFEPAEVARNLSRLSPKGKCLVNTRPVTPVTASLGNAAYDLDAIDAYIRTCSPDAIFVDAYQLAHDAGSVKAVNVVLLGVAASTGLLPFSIEVMEKVITANVPKKFMDLNLRAFHAGFEYNK